MKKIALWIVFNIPVGFLAPYLLGYALGAISFIRLIAWFVTRAPVRCDGGGNDNYPNDYPVPFIVTEEDGSKWVPLEQYERKA